MTWFLFGYSLLSTVAYLVREMQYRRWEGEHLLATRAMRKEIFSLRAELLMTKALLEEVKLEKCPGPHLVPLDESKEDDW